MEEDVLTTDVIDPPATPVVMLIAGLAVPRRES
jgi:hypothetical protein